LPGARAAAERGAIPGGTKRNAEDVAGAVQFTASVDAPTRLLLADAQTSGGLVIAVAPERLDALVAALSWERALAAAVIGRVVAGPPGRITVV
jgi:selenide,water dikinase